MRGSDGDWETVCHDCGIDWHMVERGGRCVWHKVMCAVLLGVKRMRKWLLNNRIRVMLRHVIEWLLLKGNLVKRVSLRDGHLE